MASSSSSSPEIPAATAVESEHLLSYIHATHDEVLEDLSSRFILNLPEEELASLERICFQVEQAHWFYEDFIREQNPKFPTLPLKRFSAMLFNACPMLHQWSNVHEEAFNHFMQYKTRVPVCGAIMLNDTWEKCVLVKGWKPSSGWGFPKGKINEDEPPHACAIREVLEETGYNLAGQLNKEDVIELSIKEQRISLFIVPNVPEDYEFKTRTRKEISRIEWFKLADLPTWKRNKPATSKFYLITPFIGPLKAFINERKPRAQRRGPKPKKPPQNGSNNNSNNAARRDPPPHVPEESSSQSSSLDNADPLTPSPQYSTAAPTVVQQPTNLDPDKMDPHFARLLSSLSLSAAAAAASPQTTESAVTEPAKPVELRPESLTPVPVTASSSSSQSLPSDPPLVPTPNNARSLQPTRASFQSPSPLILSPATAAHQQPGAGSEAIASPVGSIRSLSSRRTASTADISPYLARSSQMPNSAKRMKQLALLEAVADESAKMLQQTSPAISPPVAYPLPPASVPPPPFDPMHHVLYSSGPAPPQFPPHDPFQVRPWTSHAFHRAPIMPHPQFMAQRAPFGYAPRFLPGDNAGLLSILNERRAVD